MVGYEISECGLCISYEAAARNRNGESNLNFSAEIPPYYQRKREPRERISAFDEIRSSRLSSFLLRKIRGKVAKLGAIIHWRTYRA